MKTNINQPLFPDKNLPSDPKINRPEDSGIRVPEEYFDSLGLRIAERINNKKDNPLSGNVAPTLRKPYIWAPLLAASVIAILFVIIELRTKTPITLPIDEQTEIQMAYDGSYAEEVFLAESNFIDSEIENTDIIFTIISSADGDDQPTDEQVSEYLKEQEIDNSFLTEY